MNSPKATVKFDISKADDISCEKCECTHFWPVFNVKRVSPLISPTGQETLIPVQTFACVSCNHVNENF